MLYHLDSFSKTAQLKCDLKNSWYWAFLAIPPLIAAPKGKALRVCRTSIVQHAWRRGQDLSVHGWIYGIQDGLLHDLQVTVSEAKGADETLSAAIAAPRLEHKDERR